MDSSELKIEFQKNIANRIIEEAYRALFQLKELDPKDRDVHYWLTRYGEHFTGATRLVSEQEYDAAIKVVEDTAEKDEDSGIHSDFILFYSSLKLGRTEQAGNYARDILLLHDLDNLNNVMGDKLEFLAKYTAIEYLIENAIKENDHEEALSLLDDIVEVVEYEHEYDNEDQLDELHAAKEPYLKQKAVLCWKTGDVDGMHRILAKLVQNGANIKDLKEIIDYPKFAEFYKNFLIPKDQPVIRTLEKLGTIAPSEGGSNRSGFGITIDRQKRISETALIEAERRLNFAAPQSYRDFIMENGLFHIEGSNGVQLKLFSPDALETFYDFLLKYGHSAENLNRAGFGDETINRFRNFVVFSHNAKRWDSVILYMFDRDSFNADLSEMNIVAHTYYFDFDYNTDFHFFDSHRSEMCQAKGFDQFMRKIAGEIVQELIQSF